jgi:hypothetical protein
MAKVITKPVREHFGELRGITGATMEDGTVYRSSRSGKMDVADHHIPFMRRDPRVADNIVIGTSMPRVTRGRYCPVCNFSAWAWQPECPRDGTPTIEWEQGASK